jgi:hypothetical protein
MLRVFTSTIRCADPDRLDITVKGGSIFGPTWDMVMGHKSGRISDKEYSEEYYRMMRECYRENRSAWDDLLCRQRVVLVCYCAPGKFCHRLLLADMLVSLGAKYEGEI